jgi:tripartite ATP-independent transporter DctM subunit
MEQTLFGLTNPQVAILMMFIFIGVVLLGFPIGFTLLALGIFFGYYAYLDPTKIADSGIFANRIFDLVVKNAHSVMENHVLIAVPLFLFMGYVVERSGIIARLFDSIRMATANLPASMAVAALITCALFSTATGIVGAVVTLMGLLAWPAMIKAGYNKKFASGVICAGGCLGILIPPSIMFIVYAVMASLSPIRLFAAAFIPGMMLAGLYCIYCIIVGYLYPHLAPKPKLSELPPKSVIYKNLVVDFIPLLILVLLVLGAILLGLATPAEAAAAGAFGAILLAFYYKNMNWKNLKESVYLTTRSTAMIMWLFVGSWTFASVFSYLGGHIVFEEMFKAMDLKPWQFLIITQLIIFLLGFPLEWTEILIIFVPIFLPLIKFYGIDPYFFAILIGLNLQTSFLTPPMAMAAYYLKGVQSKNVLLSEIFIGMIPFLFVVILSMALLYNFQGLATWLPDVLFGAETKR